MPPPRMRINPLPLTIVAASGLAWATIAVTIGAVGPGGVIPRIFHSSHVEHFLAFYVLGVLGTAGLPSVRLHWIFLSITMLAVVFGTVRFLLIPSMHEVAIEDCLAEIAGGAAALLPILVGMHRQSFQIWKAAQADAPTGTATGAATGAATGDVPAS